MPGSLSVGNLDDDLVGRLEMRAARHGQSAEAEARDILRTALAGALANQIPRQPSPCSRFDAWRPSLAPDRAITVLG